MFSSVRAISVLGSCVALAKANSFLGAHPHSEGHSVSTEAVQRALAEELSASSSAKARALEEELRPLYTAMPKNEQGKLDPAVVRYALHRYFAQKHGWHIRGLASAGKSWNSSSPMAVMKEQVTVYIQELFERRVHGHGLDLHDLAAFAATMSDLVHAEATSDIEHIYANLGLSTTGSHSSSEEKDILERFLVAYITGYHDSEQESFLSSLRDLQTSYFAWNDANMWSEDLRKTASMQRQRRNGFAQGSSFEESAELAQTLVHNFGSFQNQDCRHVKSLLLDMEIRDTGRVPLSSFYSGKAASDWRFYESADYLRAIGALDESIPGKPSVIIPNYLTSPANCADPSEFYQVCCFDECEGLLWQVERVVAEPTASVELLAQTISNLESDSVQAPRNLTAVQLTRLQDIAEQHGGRVPLHGRLFAQWMHHAYPRECPFPHLAGTTDPVSPDEWIGGVEATNSEMDAHIESGHGLEHPDTLPWLAEEDLVASHRQGFGGNLEAKPESPLRVVFFIIAVVSLVYPMVRSSAKVNLLAGMPTMESKLEKHMV